jgi:hypothetical protein
MPYLLQARAEGCGTDTSQIEMAANASDARVPWPIAAWSRSRSDAVPFGTVMLVAIISVEGTI